MTGLTNDVSCYRLAVDVRGAGRGVGGKFQGGLRDDHEAQQGIYVEQAAVDRRASWGRD